MRAASQTLPKTTCCAAATPKSARREARRVCRLAGRRDARQLPREARPLGRARLPLRRSRARCGVGLRVCGRSFRSVRRGALRLGLLRRVLRSCARGGAAPLSAVVGSRPAVLASAPPCSADYRRGPRPPRPLCACVPCPPPSFAVGSALRARAAASRRCFPRRRSAGCAVHPSTHARRRFVHTPQLRPTSPQGQPRPPERTRFSG